MREPFEKQIGKNLVHLYNEDCRTGMIKRVQPGSVDVVVTSPPYNIGKKYNSYDDNIGRGEYLDWLTEIAGQIKLCLKDNGSFFLNIGSKPSDLWIPFEVAMRMREIFVLQNTIHWIKSIAIEKTDVGDYPGISEDVAVGHYQPVNSRRFLNNCQEYIFHFTKTGKVELDRLAIGVPYRDKTNIARWKKPDADLRCRGNTWFIPYKTIRDRDSERPHPASFPSKLAEMCIKLHGLDKTKLVLDPFNGIGNTGRACLKLGLDFIGFEIDLSYFIDSFKILKSQTTNTSSLQDLYRSDS